MATLLSLADGGESGGGLEVEVIWGVDEVTEAGGVRARGLQRATLMGHTGCLKRLPPPPLHINNLEGQPVGGKTGNLLQLTFCHGFEQRVCIQAVCS